MGRTESPNLKKDYERACGWYGHFNQSEMALFSECTDRYAQKLLDTADIVREAMFEGHSIRWKNAMNSAVVESFVGWMLFYSVFVVLFYLLVPAG